MSGGDLRGQFLYNLPPRVYCEFCRVMDGLLDLDWTRFASEVLDDQTALRLAERSERRTNRVMNQWENRNGRVGELIDLLERLQLYRPRDVILGRVSSPNPSSSPCPPLPQFDPPPKESQAPPTLSTCELSTAAGNGGGRPLPGPAPPPSGLQSGIDRRAQPLPSCPFNNVVMCWSHEEVHVGTAGFSPRLQVGEGGFGVVYRACLKNTDCAVKRLKQDSVLDWTVLKQSFKTEVEKLSKFRHPNIVDLLGFSEGGGSMCLIYSYMDNRSLEDQLHNECVFLSWSQRVGIVEGTSTALQFLHSPPKSETPLIHGDVKSSNILLDRHLVAKLSDFGLARFVSLRQAGQSTSQTTSVGRTETVRGTVAYLPDEYVRNGELGPAVDVYSFGVVLLEVLTGRRALEKDRKSGYRYLKDLVEEVEGGPTGSSEATWREQLDARLISGGAAEPAGCLQMAAVACRCLNKNRKKRPAMTEVFEKLQDIHNIVRKTSSSSSSPLQHPPHFPPPYQSFPRPPRSLDSNVEALSHQMSKLGPLEDTYQCSTSSSFSSSPFCSLTPPHPLHSTSSLPPLSSSSSSSPSSSFVGPCETDESRGFSQYDLRCQFRPNSVDFRSPPRHHDPAGTTGAPWPSGSRCSQPSVPTEDQYNFPPRLGSPGDGSGIGAPTEPEPGAPTGLSPAGSLRSTSPGPSIRVNPSKRRLMEKKTQYEDGRIETPQLLSSEDLYFGGPEESDELDYLPSKRD
ncbi:interleukin-1 receptor-associated kinase 1 [Brachyistius frenatus]|uniref:interleukin-1 receptor-associated kinase 1 n=1 Tax=Brachyistius frenatus TaxID=100188 RepID=UPI0037E94462